MSVYVVGQLRVNDWAWYDEYSPITESLIAKYGGKYLVKGGNADQLEGNHSLPDALVIIEFQNKRQVEQWYQDPEYAPMIELRKQNGVDTDLMIVEDFDHY